MYKEISCSFLKRKFTESFLLLVKVFFLMFLTVSINGHAQENTNNSGKDTNHQEQKKGKVKEFFDDLWNPNPPPENYEYLFDEENKPFPDLLTHGKMVEPEIYSIKNRAKHLKKSSLIKSITVWFADRKDRWILPALIKNWIDKDELKEMKLLKYRDNLLIFHKSVENLSTRNSSRILKTYKFRWKTNVGGEPAVVKTRFSLDIDKYDTREMRWKRIDKILAPLVRRNPSKLKKEEINYSVQNYPKQLFEKNMQMLTGKYTPSEQLEQQQKYLEKLSKKLIRQLQLGGHYLYMKYETKTMMPMFQFLKENMNLVRKRNSMNFLERYYEETTWLVRDLHMEKFSLEEFKRAIKKSIFSRIPCLIELRELPELGYRKIESQLSMIKKMSAHRKHRNFEGLIRTCNRTVFQNVKNGQWKKKNVVELIKSNLEEKKGVDFDLEKYYKQIPGYHKMYEQFKNELRQNEYDKAYEIVISWWRKMGIPNIENMTNLLIQKYKMVSRDAPLKEKTVDIR